MNWPDVRTMLMNDEGLRLKPYKDTDGKLTIGVGRNLTDVGISHDEAMILLDNDISVVVVILEQTFPWWKKMSDVRQHVLINMCFNMGISRLMGFKHALKAMEEGRYSDAADQMQYQDASKTMETPWYEETGGRAIRLVSLMRNGK